MSEVTERAKPAAPDKSMAYVVYTLYVVGFLLGAVVSIIGLVIAYLARGRTTSSLLQSHYSYQIHLFWWSFLVVLSFVVLAIGVFLALQDPAARVVVTLVVVMLLMAFAWLVTLIVFVCKGIFRLMNDKMPPNLLPNSE